MRGELISVDRARDTVFDAYKRFLDLNNDLLGICTAWQMKDEATINDHADKAYDEGVIGRTMRSAEQNQKKAPKFVKDLRKVMDDKSIDIVTIATPNHWHALAAIWAMQAGKHVYVEKPATHHVNEGPLMINAARRHKRICQVGTQSRSVPGFGRQGHGDVLSDHVKRDLVHHLRDHRIYLARHDRGSWLDGGQAQFANAAARPRGKQPQII